LPPDRHILDAALLDAAAEAPGGAGVPNLGFTSERRDPGLDAALLGAAAEAPGGAGVPNPGFTSNDATQALTRPVKALERRSSGHGLAWRSDPGDHCT
jgi:hypothetical protein